MFNKFIALIAVASFADIPVCFAAVDDQERWVGTWATGPTALAGATQYTDQTLRLIVHTSIGGSEIRVRISNTFGTESLAIGAAHVALRKADARIVPNTDRVLSFSGKTLFTVPAEALVISDPVSLRVPPLSDLAVTIYLPGLSTANTTHIVAQQTNYAAQSSGDFTGATDLPGATPTFEWDFLTGVVGPAALARFDRDVLGQAGVKYLIVLLGLNDIAQPGIVAPASEEVSADDIIAGHLQLIARAHEKGIVVYGCTIPPFENSLIAPDFYTLDKELKREAVNEWIRTSGAYDAVIDFDKAVRDPAHPLQILPAYDSGDHTHPNDAGHQALAQAIDLTLFRGDDYW